MSEWQELPLGDVASIQTGPFGSQLHSSDYVKAGIPSIMPTNIGLRLDINTSNISFITEEDAERLDKYLIQEGDIVYSRRGDVEKCAYIGKKENGWLCGTGCLRIRFKSDAILPRFCAYYLSSDEIKGWISGNAVGTTMPNLNSSILRRVPLIVPSLSEQKAIAQVLSSLDDKIDLLHRQIKTLEAIAETLFRQWFIEEAQDNWKEKKLKDILEFVVDNRGKTAPTSETGMPLIATNCIRKDNIFPVHEKVRYVSEETYRNWFRSHPEPGDLIFVNKGTPGCVNLAPNPVDFCIAQDMIALRADKNYVSNYYLFLFLRSEDMQNQIVNSSVGTTIPHLKKIDLLSFNILIPNAHKLNEFTKTVKPFFLKMNANLKQIRALEKLRDTLLPKLMNGEVRVKLN
jgi:type I restriction enzyme, S subunit